MNSQNTNINLTEKQLRYWRSLTQNNNFGDAYEDAAEALGLAELREKFRSINQQHMRKGELTLDLNRQRHQLYVELITKAKQLLNPVQYQKFYMCF